MTVSSGDQSGCAHGPSDASPASRRKFPTARPDGLLASFLLSFLATAGLFYVNIMAAIVDGLVGGLGFSESEAGTAGSANIYGAAFGALIAIAIVKKAPWRVVATICLLMLIAIDLGSTFIRDPQTMILVRAIHGVVGGLLVGVSYAVIARSGQSDRTFGALLFVQFGLGGFAVMILPPLVPTYGAPPLFLALALFSLVTLAMTPFIADYEPKAHQGAAAAGEAVAWTPLALTLAAIFLFQAANMGLLAYIIRLGINYGLARDYVSMALGLATWVALLGPGIVMVVGVKFGRFQPLLWSMALTLGGTAIFHLSAHPAAYLIANCGTGITWGLVMAYLLGMTAQFDAAGRTAAAGGFISKLGLATGPLFAGQMLAAGLGFSMLINTALLLLAVSAAVMLAPAALFDRKQRGAIERAV